MRRLLWISVAILGVLSSVWAQPRKVKLENLELRFLDVTNDPNGVELTKNPADHKISVRAIINSTDNFDAYTEREADPKGDFTTRTTINGDVLAKRIYIDWFLSFYSANPDNQTAYQLESCDIEYEADGKPRQLLNRTTVQHESFNTYGNIHNYSVLFPAVQYRISFYVMVKIKKRPVFALDITDLAAYPDIRFTYAETPAFSDWSFLGDKTKVWGNANIALSFPTKTFKLFPIGSGDHIYTKIFGPIKKTDGRFYYSWFISGNIVGWREPSEMLDLKFIKENALRKIDVLSPVGDDPLPYSEGKVVVPKGMNVRWRVSLNGSNLACKYVSKIKVTKADGTQELLDAQEVKIGSTIYYEAPYVATVSVNSVEIETSDKTYTVNYATVIHGLQVEITKTDGTLVPPGTVLPCETVLRLRLIGDLTQVKDVAICTKQIPSGLPMVLVGGYYEQKSISPPGHKPYKLKDDVIRIAVTLQPITRKVHYEQATCGTLSVKDNKGNILAPGATHSLEDCPYITVGADIAAPSYFQSFKVTFKNAAPQTYTTNPAQVELGYDVQAIELTCITATTLKYTDANLEVTLVSGQYKNSAGVFVTELGHLFEPSVVHVLLPGAKLKIKVKSGYNVKPLTSIALTQADGTLITENITKTHTEFEHVLAQSVTEIRLKEETFYTIVYEEAAAKPRLLLRDKKAFLQSNDSEIGLNQVLPSQSIIQVNGKVELDPNGVQPTPGKLITKFVVVMGGVDHIILPSAPDKTFLVSGNITEIKVVEEDDPGVTGPFKLKWNEAPTIYQVTATYDKDGTPEPIVNNTTEIPRNKVISLTITFVDTEAGHLEGVTAVFANGSPSQTLTFAPSATGYTNTELTSITDIELQIRAKNLQKFTVVYNENPALNTITVERKKEDNTLLAVPSGTQVIEGTKLYIRSELKPANVEGYRFKEIQVNGIKITQKEGEYFTYEVTAAVASIEAIYEALTKYTIHYESVQSNATIKVWNTKKNELVTDGDQLYEETPLKIEIQLSNPAEIITAVKVTYEGNPTPEVIAKASDGSYTLVLRASIAKIEVESGLVQQYAVNYSSSGDIVFKVYRNKDLPSTLIAPGSLVDAGTKIWINVMNHKSVIAMPKALFIRYKNPNYTTGSTTEAEFIREDISKKFVGNGRDRYYYYVVQSEVWIEAVYDPEPLPRFTFKYKNETGYTLDVRADTPDNPTPEVENHLYNYPAGTIMFVTVNIADPTKIVARIWLNEQQTTLEKRDGRYILPLTGDVYALRFELVEVQPNMSLLTYTDPTNGHLEIFQGGALVKSGSLVVQGSKLFAVVSEMPAGSLLSVLTVNNYISAESLSTASDGKRGMFFEVPLASVTNVVAYMAKPLPEENATRYHITVEKPEHGSLRLKRMGEGEWGLTIAAGETKEVNIGDRFEVITSSDDIKKFEFAGLSVPVEQDPSTNTLIYTVPTLSAGATHIRVVAVYAPIRKTYKMLWSLTDGGQISVWNTSENDTEIHFDAKVYAGDWVKYTITANQGYRIANCYLNGVPIETGSATTYTGTFRMDDNMQLDVAFESDPEQNEVGVDDNPPLTEQLFVTPNPFTTELRLRLPNPAPEALRVELLNAQGQLVYSASLFDELRWDTHTLPAGLYLLRIRNAKQVSTQRLIKY